MSPQRDAAQDRVKATREALGRALSIASEKPTVEAGEAARGALAEYRAAKAEAKRLDTKESNHES